MFTISTSENFYLKWLMPILSNSFTIQKQKYDLNFI